MLALLSTPIEAVLEGMWLLQTEYSGSLGARGCWEYPILIFSNNTILLNKTKKVSVLFVLVN